MTPYLLTFVLLIILMCAGTIAWLTRPLWHRPTAVAGVSVNSILHPHRSMRLTYAVTLFVAVVAGCGYALVGSPRLLEVSPASNPSIAATKTSSEVPEAQAEAFAQPQGDDSLSQAESRVSAMVDSLAERLKTRPNDGDGWQLLGRSYAALGKHSKAITAFKTAVRLKPDDPTLLAEYAFSEVVLDPDAVNGEPTRLTARALQLDPNNRKALALAGTLALDVKNYQAAIQYWEQLAQIEPPDSAMGKQVQISIAQARHLAGVQTTLTPQPALVATEVTSGPVRAQVSGTVTLAPALAAQAAPEDTVFIFARSAAGPRMPLAVLRKQVKDLPLRFTLDDSLAMSPSSKLSSVASVVVGARISKGGNAMVRDGDLQGQLADVTVGSADLKIEIDEVVRTR